MPAGLVTGRRGLDDAIAGRAASVVGEAADVFGAHSSTGGIHCRPVSTMNPV